MLCRRQRAFTLIELLVVLFIIGIMLTVATLSIGDSEADRMERTANQLVARTKLAQQQALFNGQDLALSFWKSGYAFHQRQNNAWQIMRNDNILRPRDLPDNLKVVLYLEGVKAELPLGPKNTPQVFILSDGQLTPFEAHIVDGQGSELVLESDFQGNIQTEFHEN